MIDNTKPMTPERKREIIQQLSTVITMTKAIVDTIRDMGPTPTDVVYDALVGHGLVDSGSFDRFMQLACATGSVVREGLVIRPATREEQKAHDIKVLAELVALQKEIAARG
jgi:hypothetical protein